MGLRHRVHIYSQIIVINKRIAIACLERKWTHEDSLQVDGFAIDPGSLIIELYIVDAFLRENDSLQKVFSYFLKVNWLGIHLIQTVKSSCMHDAEVDIQLFKAHPQKQNGVILETLKISRCSLASFYFDFLSKVISIKRNHTIQFVPNDFVGLRFFINILQPCRFLE